jgi:hypothetical protein
VAEKWIAALNQEVGQEQFAALQARVEPQSQQIFEQALQNWHAQHEKEE